MMLTLAIITPGIAALIVAVWAVNRMYLIHRQRQGAKFTRAFRAASILRNAARHLEQYGTGRNFEFNNARHILLYTQDLIIQEAMKAR
jgi:hypothetical protein